MDSSQQQPQPQQPAESTSQPTRLLSCYLKASNSQLDNDAIMLCEVVGDEIQSISLRVAADAMSRWDQPLDS